MNRWTVLFAAMLILLFATIGCSGGDGNPVVPTADPAITGSASHAGQSQTHLWGFYDVFLDTETQTVEAVPHREGMYHANVVWFLNGDPMNLQFNVNGVVSGLDYIDIDVDVSMKHPFPGMTQFNGYDVRGIFIADGNVVIISCLGVPLCCMVHFPKMGVTQFMKDFNETGDAELCGNPDGYTRWWNPTEFPVSGVLGYTEGNLSIPGYNGTATVNAFKYFADGLGPCDDQWDFLTGGTTDGVFSGGSTNTRNYYLRFPDAVGVQFNYAVVANWIDPTTHPANAPEAVACKVTQTESLYYIDPTDWGGNLILDVSLFDWDSTVNSVCVMDDYTIAVVSLDLFEDAPPTEYNQYIFNTGEMTPIGGGEHYSTFHVEIPASKLEGVEGNEFFVKAVCGNTAGEVFEDYSNGAGVSNDAETDTLTAYFRNDAIVLPESPCPEVLVECFWLVPPGFPPPPPPPPPPPIQIPIGPLVDPAAITGSGFVGPMEDITVVLRGPDGGSDEIPVEIVAMDLVGATGITVTFDSTGAQAGNYDIDVTNGCGNEGVGTDMIELIDSTLYEYWAADDGAGDLIVLSIGDCSWSYVSSVEAWDESGNPSGYPNSCCTILATPEINIPASSLDLHLELTHWGCSEGDVAFNYAMDGALVAYTTDGGGIYTVNGPSPGTVWLTYSSGDNFNGADWFDGLDYTLDVPGCMWFDSGDGWPYDGWLNRFFQGQDSWIDIGWGLESSPWQSDWTCNGLKDTNGVQFCFIFRSDESIIEGLGWCIRGIKVYFE